jgi:hypothetical protein
MAVVDGDLHILSITPEDLEDYSEKEMLQIHKLYGLLRNKPLQSVILQVENELLMRIK